MTELQPIIVFHSRHFVCHLEICNRIFVKLLQVMSGFIPRNLDKNDDLSQAVFLASINAAYTHDDSIRRNAMRCISPKNEHQFSCSVYQNHKTSQRCLFREQPNVQDNEPISQCQLQICKSETYLIFKAHFRNFYNLRDIRSRYLYDLDLQIGPRLNVNMPIAKAHNSAYLIVIVTFCSYEILLNQVKCQKCDLKYEG